MVTTWTTGIAASGYLDKALYDAQTILAAVLDNTPVALTVAEQTLVGRKTGGNIAALAGADALLAMGISATIAELNFVGGVTSALQTQLGLKAPLASPTFTGVVTLPTPFTLGAVSVTATGTELNFVAGVTSALQTQLNLKAPLASPTFTGTVTLPTPFTLGAVSVTATGTELNYVAGVTSAIQTQLGLKAPLASPAFTGIATFLSDKLKIEDYGGIRPGIFFKLGGGTYSTFPDIYRYQPNDGLVIYQQVVNAPIDILTTGGNIVFSGGTVVIPTPFTLGAVSVTATGTELNYVVGVTSAIQAQLNLKAPLASPTFTGAANFGSGVLRAIAPDISGVVTAAAALTLPAHTSGLISLNVLLGIAFASEGYYLQISGGLDANSGVIQLFSKTQGVYPGAIQFNTPNAALSAVNRLMISGAVNTAVATWSNITHTGLDITSGQVLKVAGVQVVAARVVDARCDDVINSGDATTDGVIDALRDAMITHGLIAAA